MSLELGSRFHLPDGRLVEVVPDVAKILGTAEECKCRRCAGWREHVSYCTRVIGCGISYTSLFRGYPRILKEVEDEQTKG